MFDKEAWNQLAQHHGVTDGDLTLKALLASHRAQAERIAQLEGALRIIQGIAILAGDEVQNNPARECGQIAKAVLTPTPGEPS